MAKNQYKNFRGIKQDVLNGIPVFWVCFNYRVEYDNKTEDFIIRCLSNNDIVGIHSDSDPSHFFHVWDDKKQGYITSHNYL